MNLIGVDLGVHKIALALFVEGEMNHGLAYESPSEAPREVQLRQLSGLAHDLACTHEVDQVWIEDVIIGNNRKYSIGLAEVKGAVMSRLAGLVVKVRLVDNKTWKKHILGNGNASKDQVRDYIHVSHGAYAPLCGGDQDLYDAACIGLYGLEITRQAQHLQLTDIAE